MKHFVTTVNRYKAFLTHTLTSSRYTIIKYEACPHEMQSSREDRLTNKNR